MFSQPQFQWKPLKSPLIMRSNFFSFFVNFRDISSDLGCLAFLFLIGTHKVVGIRDVSLTVEGPLAKAQARQYGGMRHRYRRKGRHMHGGVRTTIASLQQPGR